jgi:hypothetical protein
VIPGGSSPEC